MYATFPQDDDFLEVCSTILVFHICNLKYEIVSTELNLLENGAPTNLNRATIRLAAIDISPIEKILLHIHSFQSATKNNANLEKIQYKRIFRFLQLK